MTLVLDTILDVASGYDAIVFDQWGVLHNGTSAYAEAIATIARLGATAPRLAILSNSGKRAEPNAARIADMGFDITLFDHVMTSGEALWNDVKNSVIPARALHPIERNAGDAAHWAQGLDIEIADDVDQADGILLMGLPDGADMQDYAASLHQWRARDLPVYCSNPDRQSPRANGSVISPGALAFAYKDAGGTVAFYGKPHLPVFRAVETAFGIGGSFLMVGDSLEHDISGAQRAGWDSLLIEGGLYANDFAADPSETTLNRLVAAQGCKAPTYRMREVR